MKKLANNFDLLKYWYVRTKAVEKAHFCCSVKFRRRHLYWGMVLIVLSTFLGIITNIKEDSQSTIQSTIKPYVDVIKPGLTVIVPVLSALVTFLKYDERVTKHHNAAAKFSSLKRSLQLELVNYNKTKINEDFLSRIKSLKDAWDQLTADCPAIYKKEWSDSRFAYFYQGFANL